MKRITITIPEKLLAAADARAARLQRSRSWVIAEAVKEHTSTRRQPSSVIPEGGTVSRNDGRTSGLGESRLAQLKADLALTPERRVKEAERSLMRSERAVPPLRNRIISFDSFEDFFEWDRTDRLRP
jgi:predicted transcriptional regulator